MARWKADEVHRVRRYRGDLSTHSGVVEVVVVGAGNQLRKSSCPTRQKEYCDILGAWFERIDANPIGLGVPTGSTQRTKVDALRSDVFAGDHDMPLSASDRLGNRGKFVSKRFMVEIAEAIRDRNRHSFSVFH